MVAEAEIPSYLSQIPAATKSPVMFSVEDQGMIEFGLTVRERRRSAGEFLNLLIQGFQMSSLCHGCRAMKAPM